MTFVRSQQVRGWEDVVVSDRYAVVQGKENGMSEFIQQYYDDDAVDIIGRPLKQM